jgi:hypothetical protein
MAPVLQELYVTINLRVCENLEQFLSTSGAKQGDNLAPILFIFVSFTQYPTLSTRNRERALPVSCLG